MNPVTLLLATLMILLAATSIHYSRALKLERARAEQIAATPARPRPDLSGRKPVVDVSVPASDPSRAAGPQGTSNADESGTPQEPGERDVGTIAVARDRLARMADPQARAKRTRQLADRARMELTELAPHIGLSAAGIERIVEAMTEAAVPRDQRLMECNADPGCDASALEASTGTDYWDQFTRHMEPEMRARLKAYNDSSDERFTAGSLRDRLPAGALTDVQLEKLALAFAEERRRFVRDAQQAGDKVDEYASSSIALRSAATPGVPDEMDRRLASAKKYSARQIELASAVLDGEALSRFRELQELALEGYKRRLREREVAEAARRTNAQR